MIHSADLNLLERYSSLPKLRRIVAHWKKFAFNGLCKDPTQRKTGALTVNELKEANTALIKITQQQASASEISELANNQQVESTSKLLAFNPFLDNDGVLRVGSRLEVATVPFNQKSPAILPAKHTVTTLIIRHEHESNY